MTWTQFHDMHSGGGAKEKWPRIYIEAPEAEAKIIFYNRFGHSPDRVSCTCCGEDYYVTESPTLALASGYERGCKSLETPRNEDGRYEQPDDPWWHDHYYLEPEDEAEAIRRGWSIRESWALIGGQGYRSLEEYVKEDDVLVIRADEIKDSERTGDVPEQGYVWAG